MSGSMRVIHSPGDGPAELYPYEEIVEAAELLEKQGVHVRSMPPRLALAHCVAVIEARRADLRDRHAA